MELSIIESKIYEVIKDGTYRNLRQVVEGIGKTT